MFLWRNLTFFLLPVKDLSLTVNVWRDIAKIKSTSLFQQSKTRSSTLRTTRCGSVASAPDTTSQINLYICAVGFPTTWRRHQAALLLLSSTATTTAMHRRIESARRKLPGRGCAWPRSSAWFSWSVKFLVSPVHFSPSEASIYARCMKSSGFVLMEYSNKVSELNHYHLSDCYLCEDDAATNLAKLKYKYTLYLKIYSMNILIYLTIIFLQVAILQAVLLWWRMPPTCWWTFSASSSACCPSGSPPDLRHTDSTMAGTGQVC